TADLLHAMQALSQLSYTPNQRAAHYKKHCTACKAPPLKIFLKQRNDLRIIDSNNIESKLL
ncbi:MAG TPA: hypothetical protein PKX01_09310, partial [Rhodocyclaceae bacterium]|nr:hypothetical protein [Rhodocyclaceae bacterium]HNB64557.1 hypothetical protein [Rhodocyclaceae bacterium]HNC79136.1 hypothetical protein [Rhodocyclaceae bacterium]